MLEKTFVENVDAVCLSVNGRGWGWSGGLAAGTAKYGEHKQDDSVEKGLSEMHYLGILWLIMVLGQHVAYLPKRLTTCFRPVF